MTIVKAPGTVLLGSPETEPGRDSSDEGQWEFTIAWSFAISTTEITQEQFLTICPDFEHLYNEFAPDPQCPVNAVSWRNAQRFCRLLSDAMVCRNLKSLWHETQQPICRTRTS